MHPDVCAELEIVLQLINESEMDARGESIRCVALAVPYLMRLRNRIQERLDNHRTNAAEG